MSKSNYSKQTFTYLKVSTHIYMSKLIVFCVFQFIYLLRNQLHDFIQLLRSRKLYHQLIMSSNTFLILFSQKLTQ